VWPAYGAAAVRVRANPARMRSSSPVRRSLGGGKRPVLSGALIGAPVDLSRSSMHYQRSHHHHSGWSWRSLRAANAGSLPMTNPSLMQAGL